jgi:hypothetical protein
VREIIFRAIETQFTAYSSQLDLRKLGEGGGSAAGATLVGQFAVFVAGEEDSFAGFGVLIWDFEERSQLLSFLFRFLGLHGGFFGLRRGRWHRVGYCGPDCDQTGEFGFGGVAGFLGGIYAALEPVEDEAEFGIGFA